MLSVNIIRNKIELAIEISADSGVPVLFLANPGLAKSTIVANWAARMGLHLETLIGSRFTQEEILGFQVRVEDKTSGEQYLELLEPHWYRNILCKEKKGIHSLLFLDELSTAQENVQGALLQLIFDRTIGHGKKLPESTLVVSAANYKQNIPYMFNIMAPILNRFCIVNLQYESNSSFLDEFLQDENAREYDVIILNTVTINEQKKEALRSGLKKLWNIIFTSFNDAQKTDAKTLAIDINNQVYNNIYENDTRFVYNFITGRTLFYLYRITLSFLRKGVSLRKHSDIMLNMVYGLVGLGSNTFNELQQKSFLKQLENLWSKLYLSLETDVNQTGEKMTTLNFADKTVCDAINEWCLFHDSNIFSTEKDHNLSNLIEHIKIIYPTVKDEQIINEIKTDKTNYYRAQTDIKKIDYLIEVLKNDALAYNSSFTQEIELLTSIYNIYNEYTN